MRTQDLDKSYIFRGVTYSAGKKVEVPDDFPTKPGAEHNREDSHPMGTHVTQDGVQHEASGVVTQGGEKVVGLHEIPKGSSGSGVALEHAVGAGVNISEHGGQLPIPKAGKEAEKAAEQTAKDNLKEAKADAKDAGVDLNKEAAKTGSHTVGQV